MLRGFLQATIVKLFWHAFAAFQEPKAHYHVKQQRQPKRS